MDTIACGQAPSLCPDIFVQNAPAVLTSGRDEQLEAAIEQMLKELEQ